MVRAIKKEKEMKQLEKQSISERLQSYVVQLGSQNKAAASLQGVSAATLSQMLNGNWDLISDEMWRSVAVQIGYDGSGWQVVETLGYRRMCDILCDAQSNSLVFAVTGDAGCGKTQAIRHYQSGHSNVVVLSCSEFWNRRHFLCELLKGLGQDAQGNQVVEMMTEAVYTLKRRSGMLLVLDEADKLNDQVLHFFITLYNQLEDTVGIVLCATQYLEKRIKRGVANNRKGYREIYSRVGRKFIPMPVVNGEDIASVCMANGVCDSKTIRRIIDDADCDLRRVKRLIHAAKQQNK